MRKFSPREMMRRPFPEEGYEGEGSRGKSRLESAGVCAIGRSSTRKM